MAGSHRSPLDATFIVVVVALISLLGVACSTTSETSTAGSDFVQRTAPTEGSDSGSTALSTDDERAAPLYEESTAAVAGPGSAVLALALERAEGLSYSYEQGFAMHMNFAGMEFDLAPTDAFAHGHVDGDSMYMAMDLGVMMSEIAAFDPAIASPTDDESAVIEMWTEGDVMTLDLSEVADLSDSDAAAIADYPSELMNGPVSIDLAGLEGIGSTDIAGFLADGSQTADPASMAATLRNLDSVMEVGTDVLNGREVTVYAGTLSLADYAEALGEDLDDQFGGLDQFGLGSGTDAQLLGALGPTLEALVVEATVMIDADDLVRRLEMHIDMAPMFTSMFSDEGMASVMGGDDELGAQFEEYMATFLTDIEMTMDLWIAYDNYGESFAIDAPASTDITPEFSSLFADLVAA